MIHWSDLLIVAGVIALVGTYMGLVHRFVSAADEAHAAALPAPGPGSPAPRR